MLIQIQNNSLPRRQSLKNINSIQIPYQAKKNQNFSNLSDSSTIIGLKSQILAFSGTIPKSSWKKTAVKAHAVLSSVLESGKKLTQEEHGNLILKLHEKLGSKSVTLTDPSSGTRMVFDSGLVKKGANGKAVANLENLNRDGVLKTLVDTLKTTIDATSYTKNISFNHHVRTNGKKVKIAVNNPEVFEYFKTPMTSQKFGELFRKTEKKGVFDLRFDSGVPSVTDAAGSAEMTRKWARDHAGMMRLIDKKYPEQGVTGLKTWAKTYSAPEEVAAFERVIKNPATYKENGGVAHVFWFDQAKGDLVRDPSWGNNQRIESHTELLNTFASKIKNGLTGKDPAGFKSPKDISDDVIDTTIRFTHYLNAVGPNAQTAGPWEEIPFSKGANWDTTSSTQAFRQVKELVKLLHKPENTALKEKFLQSEQKLMKKTELPANKSLFGKNTSNLDKYIKEGENTVRANYMSEFRGVTDRTDSSSAMITASDINLSPAGNVVEDVERHLAILEKGEKNLIGEFGGKRYNEFEVDLKGTKVKSPDSYLNKSFDLAFDPETDGIHLRKAEINEKFFGGKDASEPPIFMARARGVSEETSAQWGLTVSYSAIGYGKQVRKLLNKYEQTGGNLSEKELKLLKRAFNGEEEHIARAYGNITGTKPDGSLHTRANGQDAIPWKKPEAYMAVPTLIPQNPKDITSTAKKVAYVPGSNGHLGWDAAKTYEASELHLQNLKDLEKTGLLAKLRA